MEIGFASFHEAGTTIVTLLVYWPFERPKTILATTSQDFGTGSTFFARILGNKSRKVGGPKGMFSLGEFCTLRM